MSDTEPTEQPAAAPATDQPRTIALRHPGGQVVRCAPDEADEWTAKGYVPVPHSGGHNNPPPTA